MGVRKIIRNHIARSCLIILLLLSVLLVPVSSQDPEPNIEYILGMNELPGGIVSPGGASSFRFEYEHNGERLLFWGWTGPNDIRVMGEDLTTLHIIDLPSESFDVSDAKWSHGGSIIVLGNNGTGAEDTLLVYRTPLFEQNPTFLPREAIPLVTIDAASLLAGDNILAVAGRDINGTSSVIILETTSNRIRSQHEMYDNLTVQVMGDIGTYLHAVDVMGGSSIFNTTQWVYEERIEPSVGPCQFSVLRTNLPWTSGGVDGRLVVREFIMLNRTVIWDVDIPPVQASTYIMNKYSSNVIVASPNGEGGSKIQVLHDHNGSFEVGPEINTDMTITSMMLTPGEANVFGVGFSNGGYKQYNVTDEYFFNTTEPDPNPDPGPGPDGDANEGKDMPIWLIGIVIILVVTISLLWILKVRAPREKS